MSLFLTETEVVRADKGPSADAGIGADDARQVSRWTTDLTAEWNIAGNPNGGYAAASSLRAMLAMAPDHPDIMSVTTHYLRPSTAGSPADIEVEVMRRGRRTSTLRSTLSQESKPRLTTVASLSSFDLWRSPHRFPVEPHPIPPPEECLDRSELRQGVDLPILSRLEVRLDPAVAEAGSNSQAVMSGWIRFVDGADPSVLSLPLFADSFPPSPMTVLGQVGWIPTVELTVHVRARPAPGWIRAHFRARDINNGTLIEDGLLWDSSGALVAQCRQIALLMAPGK